jgi:hypothetical protein
MGNVHNREIDEWEHIITRIAWRQHPPPARAAICAIYYRPLPAGKVCRL